MANDMHATVQTAIISCKESSKKLNGIKRIHIIGAAGSGKTYTSIRLGNLFNLKPVELDELFWDKESLVYGLQTEEKVRDTQLDFLVRQDSWIIEGIYFDWVNSSFNAADIIIWLQPNLGLCILRMIIRFLKEKLGFLQVKKSETYMGFLMTLRRNIQNYFYRHDEISRILIKYDNKVLRFRSGDSVVEYFLSLSTT